MMDLIGYAAPDVYRAIRAGQDAQASQRTWLLRLRDLQRIEREGARKQAAEPRPPSGPRTLKGAFTPWI